MQKRNLMNHGHCVNGKSKFNFSPTDNEVNPDEKEQMSCIFNANTALYHLILHNYGDAAHYIEKAIEKFKYF